MKIALDGNNKEKLNVWVYFLTQTHNFAEKGVIKLREDRSKGDPKYSLFLTGCTNESIRWMVENLHLDLAPPVHPIVEFKRPLKVVKLSPAWKVHRNLELNDCFVGNEFQARLKFEELKKQPRTFGVRLYCEELKVSEQWRR